MIEVGYERGIKRIERSISFFYKKALNDKDAIACGCLKDAEEWLIDELNKLFEEQE